MARLQIAPVFFYNDVLARPDEPIGLNLFEERYKLMCQRMHEGTARKELLFLPNFEDYYARPGDVGYLVDVTYLRFHPGRGTWSMRGQCRSPRLVETAWVEPGSGGLHMACFRPLPGDAKSLAADDMAKIWRALIDTMRPQPSASGAAPPPRDPCWMTVGHWQTGEPKMLLFNDPSLPKPAQGAPMTPPPFMLISANLARVNQTFLFLRGIESAQRTEMKKRIVALLRKTLQLVEPGAAEALLCDLPALTPALPATVVLRMLDRLAADEPGVPSGAMLCRALAPSARQVAVMFGVLDCRLPPHVLVNFCSERPKLFEVSFPGPLHNELRGISRTEVAMAEIRSRAGPSVCYLYTTPANLGLELEGAVAGLTTLSRQLQWKRIRLLLIAHRVGAPSREAVARAGRSLLAAGGVTSGSVPPSQLSGLGALSQDILRLVLSFMLLDSKAMRALGAQQWAHYYGSGQDDLESSSSGKYLRSLDFLRRDGLVAAAPTIPRGGGGVAEEFYESHSDQEEDSF